MSVAAETARDALAGGFYTVSEAARLLQIDSSRAIYGWLAGHTGVRADPVIRRDYQPIAGSQELSFWDLMEVRFIHHFRKQGVPLQTLRRTAEKARRDMRKKHPFALSNLTYMTDRKRIFSQVVEETGDQHTMDILGDQYEMYEVIEFVLARNVAFHPITGLAESFQPLGEYPSILVDPRFAYGKPVVARRGIPTAAIFRQVRAEKGNKDRVAHWFGVSVDEVDEAIGFETKIGIRLAN